MYAMGTSGTQQHQTGPRSTSHPSHASSPLSPRAPSKFPPATLYARKPPTLSEISAHTLGDLGPSQNPPDTGLRIYDRMIFKGSSHSMRPRRVRVDSKKMNCEMGEI